MAGKDDVKKEKKRRAKTEISVAVGKAIAERRKIARLTQQAIAEAIGVEKETVSRYESGETAQTVDRLAALSKILGCAVRDFFEEEKRDANKYVAAIEHMIAPLSDERQERVVRCVAEIVGAWKVN